MCPGCCQEQEGAGKGRCPGALRCVADICCAKKPLKNVPYTIKVDISHLNAYLNFTNNQRILMILITFGQASDEHPLEFMQYGICPYSVVPLRSAPAHSSEMLSQLLFGEMAEILETRGRQWSRVSMVTDGCEGWVETTQLQEILPEDFARCAHHFAYSLELTYPAMGPDQFIPITIGARLPNFDGLHFRLGKVLFTFSGQTLSSADIRPGTDFLVKMARRYLNTPFLWGGRSPFGIDAPGFVQMIYSFAGIPLPRTALAQLEQGTSVDFPEEALPGDIAFFENRAGKITHAGIVLPENKIIHAYGCVRTDLLDHYGIYDESRKIYTRRLRLIKRLLPQAPAPAVEAAAATAPLLS
jgi:hypothetical protein